MFQERTWKDVTTEVQPYSRRCPIEGECGEPDEEWRARILERLEDAQAWPNVEFIVFVQCVDMCSSHLGAHNVIIGGPGYTWTKETIEELKKNPCSHWYGDLPSQRMYPQWYITREAHLKTKEAAHAPSPAGD